MERWRLYSSYCGPRYRIYLKPIGIHMKCFDTEKKCVFFAISQRLVYVLGHNCELQKLKTNKAMLRTTDAFFFCPVSFHYF